jgi:hypothetical protein
MHRAAALAASPVPAALPGEVAMAAGPEPSGPGPSRGGYDVAWNRIGRNAGYISGGAFFLTTLLFLLDSADLLAPSPAFHVTAAGRLQDLATYFVAFFAHQHQILWDIALRDTLGPISDVGLIVLVLAIANLLRWRGAAVQLMVLFGSLGAVLMAISSLTFLAEIHYWRATDWIADPAANMVAVGRASAAIDALTVYPEVAGFAALAIGLVYLGRLCRTRDELPSRLSGLAYVEALALLGAGVATVTRLGAAYNVLALVTGVLIAPVLAIWLGRHFAGLDRSQQAASAADGRLAG